jgi:ankyrin repeat protein
MASCGGNADSVAALLKAKADVSTVSGGFTMKSEKGIQFEIKFAAGQTALHLACASGSWSVDVVPLLLQAGSDPLALDANGSSALALASQRTDSDRAKIVEMCRAAERASLASEKNAGGC